MQPNRITSATICFLHPYVHPNILKLLMIGQWTVFIVYKCRLFLYSVAKIELNA